MNGNGPYALPSPPVETNRDFEARIAKSGVTAAEVAVYRKLRYGERPHGGRLGARPLGDVPTDPPPPLAVGRCDPAGHTILYGPGGVGKGVLASSWTVQLVRDGHRVLIVDYENHPDEWARRVDGLGGADALAGALWVGPFTTGWAGRRGPLWAQADDLRALADETGATFLIVDSIVPACGATDATKPEAAAQYAGALELIGRPVLSIGHVTKAESLAYPFGSAFWHNLARVTWSLARDGQRAILANRKANNYSGLGRFAVETTWTDGRPGECWERGYSAVLGERIAECLDEPRTVAEIVAALNAEEDTQPVKSDTVSKSLRRGLSDPQRYTVSGTGPAARWSLSDGTRGTRAESLRRIDEMLP